MATRLFFPETEAAPVAPPAPEAGWEHNNGVTRKLRRTVDSSTLTTTAYTPDAADDHTSKDAMHRQYVSDPLLAQNISGNVKAQFQCLEANAGNNLFITLKIYIISNDGTTAKETLLAITRETTTELGTSLANRQFSSLAISAADVEEGDRLCVEVGLGGTCTAAGGVNGHNGSIRFGCNASSGDLPEDETQTGTTYRPWIEFDDTIGFRETAAPADTVGLAETETEQVQKTWAETLGLGEAFAAVRVAVAAIGDTVSLVESAVKQVNKAVGETVALAETFVKSLSRSVAETVGLTESRQVTVNKSAQDAVDLAESIAREHAKTLAETAGLAEELIPVTIPAEGGGGTPGIGPWNSYQQFVGIAYPTCIFPHV